MTKDEKKEPRELTTKESIIITILALIFTAWGIWMIYYGW